MNTYLIINGTVAYSIIAKSNYDAKTIAIDICDHSEAIIVRRVDKIVFLNTND